MTIDQHLLIRIYASQQVHLKRILEMVCAIQETIETKEEPTGLLFGIVNADTEKIISELITQLSESHPGASPFYVINF